MPTLQFSVEADFDKVIRLKDEIAKLETELKGLGKNASADAVAKLERRLSECKNEMGGLVSKAAEAGSVVEREGDRMASAMSKVGAAVAGAFAVSQIKDYIVKVAQIRGEFQKLEISFTTMLGSADKANALMQELMHTAAITPFSTENVMSGAKQLLAFGIEAEKVNNTLIRLGDIAAGTGAQVGQLTNVYGQIRAAGKMNGGDLLQFINAGVPIIKALADTMGVAESAVKDLISAGKVGFPEVDKAIQSLTDSGSMFGGMMEEQSKTITGQWSTLKDNIEQIFNEIGKANEGVISDAIGGVATLVENYETVGKALVSLVATYGAYRVAVATNLILTQGFAAAAKADAIAKGLQTIATTAATAAQNALNTAIKANPYVAAATALVGIVGALWTFSSNTDDATRATEELNKKQEEAKRATEEHTQKMQENLDVATDLALADVDRGRALSELRAEYPKIFQKYDIEKIKLADILKLKQEIADEDRRRAGAKQKKEEQDAEGKLRGNVRYYDNIANSNQYGKLQRRAAEKERDKAQAELNALRSSRAGATSEAFLGVVGKSDSKQLIQYRNAIAKAMKGKGREGALDIQLPISINGEMSEDTRLTIKQAKDLIVAIDKKRSENAAKANAPKQTNKSRLNNLRQEWVTAEKKLKDFMDNSSQKLTDEQFETMKNDLTAKAEQAKNAYKNAGGETSTKSSGKSSSRTQKDADREAQERLNAQKRNDEELARLHQANLDADIANEQDANKKRLREIENNWQKRKAEIEKQTKEFEELNEKQGKGRTLTDEQQKALAEAERVSNEQRRLEQEAFAKERADAEKEAMQEYLIAYGEYQEKRVALTEQYEEKIAKAKTEGEKKTLQKQLTDALTNLDTDQLKKSINWEEVFGNLDKVSTSGLKRIKTQLQEFIKTQKDLSPESMKELVQAIENIDNATNERSPFKAFGDDMKSLLSATEEVKEAQEAYNKALANGTAQEIEDAKQTLINAQNKKRKALAETTASMSKAVKRGKEYLEAGDTALDLITAFGAKPPVWMEKFLSGMSETLNGLESIDFTKPMSIVTGLMKAITGIAHTIGGVFGGQGNKSAIEKANSALVLSNQTLTTSIDRLTKEMASQSPKDAFETYEKAVRALDAKRDNDLSIMRNNASQWEPGGHSLSYEFNKRFGKGSLQSELSGYLGESIKSLDDLLSLPVDKLNSLYNDDKGKELLNKILQMLNASENSHNYQGLGKDLLDYIENYRKSVYDELQNTLRETVTKVSFDSFKDEFKNALTDMNSTATDFSNNFTQMLRKSVANAIIEKEFSERIQSLYTKWNDALKDDNSLDEQELADLRQEQADLTNAIMMRKKEIDALLGTSAGAQSASHGYSQEMSEDTAKEISGRLTAVLESGERRNENILLLSTKLDVLTQTNSGMRDIASDTRDIIAQSYLELQGIRENTEAVIKPIKQIAEDVAGFKNSGIKTK